MSAITYGELHYGACKSRLREKALTHLEELVQDIPVENIDSTVCWNSPSNACKCSFRKSAMVRSPADFPRPILEKRHPPPSASEFSATKRPPRNNHRAGSWSSSADDTEAGPLLPLHTRSRSPKGPVGPPRRIRNTTGDHRATTPEGLRATANSALEGRCGMFLPCSKNSHTFRSLFNRIQQNGMEFSDTLLAYPWRTGRSRSRTVVPLSNVETCFRGAIGEN